MWLHVTTLFRIDPSGRLRSVNEPGGGTAPRFFLGRTPDGNVWAVRHDLDEDLVQRLTSVCEAEPPGVDADLAPDATLPYLDVLAADQPVEKIWTGPAYRFPSLVPEPSGTVAVTSENASVLTPYLEAWIPDAAVGVPMCAAVEDGKAVSVCCSVRVGAGAHEAGVETHPEFRQRGHGVRAVAAWATAAVSSGSLPLYSTSWENEASQGVARKLGLVQFGSDFHAT